MNTVMTPNKNFPVHNSRNITYLSNYSVDFLNASKIINSTNIGVDDFEMCRFFYGKYGMSVETKNLVNGLIEILGPLIGFIIPILVISFCYANIVTTVRRKTIETSSRAPVGRVTTLSTMVIIAFVICWTPQKVLNLWSAFCGWLDLCPFDEMLYDRVYPFCLVLAWTNSIMNPILYALTTPTIRKYLGELFPFLKIRLNFHSIRTISRNSFRRRDTFRQNDKELRSPLCSCAQQQNVQEPEGDKTLAEALTPTPEIARNLHGTAKFLTPRDGNFKLQKLDEHSEFRLLLFLNYSYQLNEAKNKKTLVLLLFINNSTYEY